VFADEKDHYQFKIHPTLPAMEFRLVWQQPTESTNDRTVQKIEVWRQGDAKPTQILDARMDETPAEGQTDFFSAQDINFDGYQDIKLQIMWGATGNRIFDFYVYHPATQQFVFSPAISQLSNPLPLADKQELEVFWNGGMAGEIYSKDRYKIKGEVVTLVYSEHQNWDPEQQVLIKVIKVRKNDTLVTIKKERRKLTDDTN
jgi:hypothetical protein